LFLIGCDAEAKGCAFSAREATVSSAYSMSIGLRAGLGFRGRLTCMLGMLRQKPAESHRETIADEREPSFMTDCIRLHRLVRQVAAERRAPEASADARQALVEALAAVYPKNLYTDPKTWPRMWRLHALVLALIGGDARPQRGRAGSRSANRARLP
jgi:hypothetical protein